MEPTLPASSPSCEALPLPSDSKRDARSVRSRSIGSLNHLLSTTNSSTRPITPPSPSRSPSDAVPSRPALEQPRRSSTTSTSTSSSNSSSLLHLAASSLKGHKSGTASTNTSQRTEAKQNPKSKRGKRSRGKRGTIDEGTLEEQWSTTEFDHVPVEDRASQDMARTKSSVSTSSQRSNKSDSSKASPVLGAPSGGGGKFVQSLRRTRSKLGLMASGGKGKDAEEMSPETEAIPTATAFENGSAQDEEEDGMMIQSPVLTFVEPPSPSESRTFSHNFDSHESGTPSIISTSPTTSSFSATSPSFAPSIPHSASTTQRIGGWFSSMLNTSTSSNSINPSSPVPSSRSSSKLSSPNTSPEKQNQPQHFASRQRGSSHSPSSTRTFFSSPTKKLSHSSLSLPPPSSTGTSSHQGALSSPASTSSRLGPLDRMLDKAVQYFLDTDSNADKCPDEIWLFGGIRHEGWRPSPSPGAVAGGSRDDEYEGAGKKPDSGGAPTAAKRWSPVKSRSNQASKDARQRQARERETSGATIAESDPGRRDESPSPSLRSFSTTRSGDSGPPRSITPVSASASTPSATTINGWPASFYRDFYSRPALTYRTNFSPIPCSPAPAGSRIGAGATGAMHGMFNSLSLSIGRGGASGGARDSSTRDEPGSAAGLTSDTGWGCMLRTGQSLLANALVSAHLGRDWRRPLPPTSLTAPAAHGQPSPPPSNVVALPDAYATYTRILSLFLDSPSPASPFSVHKFALEGQRLGKSVGEWFGPSTAAGAIKRLVNDYEPAGVAVVSCVDGTLYENEVVAASQDWNKQVLVLLNLRLGIDGVNPIYHEAIKGIFRIPQSVGIAGGRPSSSYYFVGSQANSLFYIDPHHPRPAVAPIDLPDELVAASSRISLSKPAATPVTRDGDGDGDGAVLLMDEDRAMLDSFFATAYDDAAWRTYHCDKVRKCNLSSLDPSMLVGFLVRDERDWREFKLHASELGRNSSAIFSIAPSPPKWMRRSSSIAVPLPNPSSSAAPTTTLATTSSSMSVSPGEDSFSELDDESIARDGGGRGPSLALIEREGEREDDDDDEVEFSEPEGWELDSTDASETTSLRDEPTTTTRPLPAPPLPSTTSSATIVNVETRDERDADDEEEDDDSDPVFVDSRTSLRSRESTRTNA